MHKKFKDCKLKGLILSAIRNGNNTGKTIYPAIQYPHHIDTLYAELHFLRRQGYISAKKTGRISTYTLTKKGLQHAQNPYLFKDEKHNRFAKKLNNALEDTLRNEPMVKQWAMKFAKEIAEHPVIEAPQPPNVMVANPNTNYEFLDNPVPAGKQVQSPLDEIRALLDAKKKAHPNQQPQISTEERLQIFNNWQGKRIKELLSANADLKNENDILKNEKIQSPVSIPTYSLSTQNPPASSHSSGWREESSIKDGKVVTKKVRIPKEPTQDETDRRNERKALARQYKGYSLDKDFFAQWSNGNLRPILMVKDAKGFKKLDIISVNNTVSKQNLVKLDYYAQNRIEELELYIESIHGTGITICSDRIANFRKVLEW